MKSRSSIKSNLFRVKVKSTGKLITVYKLLLGGYCDANNHTTTYAEANLEFIDNDNDNKNNDLEKIERFK